MLPYDRIKQNHDLSAEGLSLLEFFIESGGHGLSKYDLEHHASLKFPVLDGKNIHEIILDLVNKCIVSFKSDVYTLTGKFKADNNIAEYVDSSEKKLRFGTYEGVKNAMPSLNAIFQNDSNVVYVFLAITPHYVFVKLMERIERKRKTIFFMPDVSCFRNTNEKNKHRDVLKGWIEFIKKQDTEFVEFYLVKNRRNDKNRDRYSFLYSSLLAKSTVRFNIYKYDDDGRLVSGVGKLIECKTNENSLYDIVERCYTDAWNERIGVRKINGKMWIKRFFSNNIYWILFSTLMLIVLISAFIFVKMLPSSQSPLMLLLDIFVPAISLVAFPLSLFKSKITKLFYRKKLPF